MQKSVLYLIFTCIFLVVFLMHSALFSEQYSTHRLAAAISNTDFAISPSYAAALMIIVPTAVSAIPCSQMCSKQAFSFFFLLMRVSSSNAIIVPKATGNSVDYLKMCHSSPSMSSPLPKDAVDFLTSFLWSISFLTRSGKWRKWCVVMLCKREKELLLFLSFVWIPLADRWAQRLLRLTPLKDTRF